jgi:uncharacterized protein (UPF0218 family)
MASSPFAFAEFARTLHLPEELREELRIPLGPVVDGAEAVRRLRDVPFVVTVGDACTIDLVSRGRRPNVAIVDFKTKRQAVATLRQALVGVADVVVSVDNPAATLAADVWTVLAEAFKSEKSVRVDVRGEEDLTALAAIALAPEGSAVLYGMPDRGVVLVAVNARAKERVRGILERMVE